MEHPSERFRCPACGADMAHSAMPGGLVCSRCGHTENGCIQDTDVVGFDFSAAENDPSRQNWGVPVRTLICPGCHGRMVAAAIDSIQSCPFCGTSPIVDSDEAPGIRPDDFIPFNVDEAAASRKRSEWIAKCRLAPSSFKRAYVSGPLKGVFLPYWAFNATVKASYVGQTANSYTDTEMSTVSVSGHTEVKPSKVKKLRWRFVSGSLDRNFTNVIYSDVEQLDQKTLARLEPYKLNELTRFAPKNLTGYVAAHAKNGLSEMWQRALAYMGGTVREQVRHTVKRGGDALGAVNTRAEFGDVSFKQWLLPLWIGAYRYKNRIYHVYINGQTGFTFGTSPKSLLKIGLFVLAASAIAALFVLIF